MTESDDQIVREFLIESRENLDRLDRDIVVLESQPASRPTLDSAFRMLHTIKGTCGFLGFPRLEAISHRGEALLSCMRDGQVTMNKDVADVLLRLVDTVRTILDAIEATGAESEGDDQVLFRAVDRIGSHNPPATPQTDETVVAPDGTSERLFDHMIARGRLEEEQVQLAARQQALGDPRLLGEILVDNGALEPHDVLEALHHRSGDARSDGPQTIRVDLDLLEGLVDQVGELVLTRNQILQVCRAEGSTGLPKATQRLDAITTGLHESIMKARMQPLEVVWQVLPRLVRDIAAACGKRVRLETRGGETELDRTLLEAIRDPLLHLVRNAIDHGVESPAARREAGKPTTGTVRLVASHHGGQVRIEVGDDGGGIAVGSIRERALARGLVTPHEAEGMTEAQWLNLIFVPGFSTAERVTTVSGRGVGMDVVRNNLERLGGTVGVDSRPGTGTTFRIEIPLTLAIIPALFAVREGELYAIPQANVLEVVRAGRDSGHPGIERLENRAVFRLREQLLPLVDLPELFGSTVPASRAAGRGAFIVVLQADGLQFGLLADEIRDTSEIVVKSLGRILRQTALFSGATITGDGRACLILDVPGIARRAGLAGREAGGGTGASSGAPAPATATRPFLLVRLEGDRRAVLALEEVRRIERITSGSIDRVSGRWVLTRRDQILPLVSVAGLTGATIVEPGADTQAVVVSHYGHDVGLVVDRVMDIVSLPPAALGSSPGGAAIVEGHAVEVLAVPELLEQARERKLIEAMIEAVG